MNLSELFAVVDRVLQGWSIVGLGLFVFFFGAAAYGGYSVAKRLEGPILFGGFFLALVIMTGIMRQQVTIELFTNPAMLILEGGVIGVGCWVYQRLNMS